jgi:hypothetical protein
MTSRTKAQESEATQYAHTELLAIIADLRAIKVRLLATEKRLRAAAPTAVVVEVDSDGEPLTLEKWTADMIGDTLPKTIDDLMKQLGYAADADDIRATIRDYVERERSLAARIAARRAAGN